MKFNPLYKRQYLSQTNLGLYKSFMTAFWGCPKMIQHSKVDQIILNSSQKPSTSSKYDYILDALLIRLESWKLTYLSRMTYKVDSGCIIWYQRWSNPPKFQSGTFNVLQYDCGIDVLISMLWSCKFEYNSGMKNLISDLPQSSKTPVRNHQHPPSMTVFLMHF